MAQQLITPTITTAAQAAALEIVEDINKMASMTALRHKLIFRKLWHNTAATPEEILEALGTNAVMVFVAGGGNIDMLAGVAAMAGKSIDDFLDEEDRVPSFPVDFHADGTVTPSA